MGHDLYFGLEHFFPSNAKLRVRRGRAKDRIVAELRDGGPGRSIPVDRRHDLSPEQFRSQYLRTGTPVVFAGGADGWPVMEHWSFGDFRRRFGGATVKLVQREGLTDDDVPSDTEYSEELQFGDFLDGVLSGGKGKYMRFSPLLEQFPELLEDFDHQFFQRMTRSRLGQTYQMFIGGDGTITPFHNAVSPFLFTNVAGVKHWSLIPVEYTAILAPKADRHEYNHSSVAVDLSNVDDFPGLGHVDRYHAVTEPGDLLFVPSWMWHSVTNVGPTIGVRCGFMYLPGLVRESLTLTLLRLVAGELGIFKWFYYSFIRTDLPQRTEFLVTPKWIRFNTSGSPRSAEPERSAGGP